MKRLIGLQGLDFFQFLSCLLAFAPAVPSAGNTLPHTPFPGNAYMSFKWKFNAMSSRTLSLTTQRRLNTTHLAWNIHHILSQLLVTCFPCYNTRFVRRSTLLYAFIHIFLANRQRIKDNHNTHCM